MNSLWPQCGWACVPPDALRGPGRPCGAEGPRVSAGLGPEGCRTGGPGEGAGGGGAQEGTQPLDPPPDRRAAPLSASVPFSKNSDKGCGWGPALPAPSGCPAGAGLGQDVLPHPWRPVTCSEPFLLPRSLTPVLYPCLSCFRKKKVRDQGGPNATRTWVFGGTLGMEGTWTAMALLDEFPSHHLIHPGGGGGGKFNQRGVAFHRGGQAGACLWSRYCACI